MATSTFGSTLTTSMTAQQFSGAPIAADVATIQNAIKDDIIIAHPVWPGAWSSHGLLYVPNRGVLQVRPGDWVAVDANGWPILVSSYSVTTGGWTHVP